MNINNNVLVSKTTRFPMSLRFAENFRYATGPSGPAIEVLDGVEWCVFSVDGFVEAVDYDGVVWLVDNDGSEIELGTINQLDLDLIKEFSLSVCVALGL